MIQLIYRFGSWYKKIGRLIREGYQGPGGSPRHFCYLGVVLHEGALRFC